jgi:hypothetical protein
MRKGVEVRLGPGDRERLEAGHLQEPRFFAREDRRSGLRV